MMYVQKKQKNLIFNKDIICQKLKELLLKWPSEIYNMSAVDQSIRLESNAEQTAKGLLECSAIM